MLTRGPMATGGASGAAQSEVDLLYSSFSDADLVASIMVAALVQPHVRHRLSRSLWTWRRNRSSSAQSQRSASAAQ